MGKITYKNLYQQVMKEVAKKGFTNKGESSYSSGTRTAASNISPDVSVAEIISATQEILKEALPSFIISGLSVTATSPESNVVNISSGKGSASGILYELDDDITFTIDFGTIYSEVIFLNLYKDRVLLEEGVKSDRLTLAKIIVPKPGTTSRVFDKKPDDNSWDAYIQSFKEYKLYGTNNKLEEDSIELLRDNIGEILADNLIGNIKLSENLKVTNTQGTVEIDSKQILIKDELENTLAKFDKRGTYFYNTAGVELSRFTSDGAKVGNIEVNPSNLQSSNFVTGNAGFRLSDDGNAEFNDVIVRGTIYATVGEIGGFTIESDKLYGGDIRTGENVGAGENGVKMDTDGLHVYNSVLGRVVYLPSDGSAPQFSSGVIQSTTFEISTNSVLRTSNTVGDGTSSSEGILINNTGIYGCGANQTLSGANLKALADGSVSLTGVINATSGNIGNVTISDTGLSGGLIEGTSIVAGTISTSNDVPRITIDTEGIRYQLTTDVGTYGTAGSGSSGFLYGDGTKYGAGTNAVLFDVNYPILAVLNETSMADIRLYNRNNDPTSGSHEIGDLIVVSGKLKICTTSGSPGTFTVVGTQT